MTASSTLSILGICGSLRKHSYNRMLLHTAAQFLPKEVDFSTVDISEIPLLNEDILQIGMPAAVSLLRERIAQSDALLIASPEYNHSVSGVLKNAIDWASREPNQPLSGKPLGILGASQGNFGTVRAQAALRQICVATNMLPMSGPEVFITKANEKFDLTGRLIHEPSSQVLAKYIERFVAWSRRLLNK